MNKISIFICILFSVGLHAQTLDRMVVSSGGNHVSSEKVQLQYTIGQSIATTLSIEMLSLTQGFQQPEVKMTTRVNDFRFETLAMEVYPNPVTHRLTVVIEGEKYPLFLSMFDLKGSLISSVITAKGESTYWIDMENLVAGVYVLHARSDRLPNLNRSIRIIKID